MTIPVNNAAIHWHYVFKIVPILGGCLSIYLGYELFIKGVTGAASLVIDAEGINGQLINAAPGLFFALGGLVVIGISVWRGVSINFIVENGSNEKSDSPSKMSDEEEKQHFQKIQQSQ